MKTKQLVFAAIFVALVFVTTSIIQFNISFGAGYVHFGDMTVMLSGMLLGPVFGGIASGLGSALADIQGGYAMYAPATLVVKALLAFGVGLVYKKMNGQDRDMSLVKRNVLHSVVAVIILAGGYFVSDLILGALGLVSADGKSVLTLAAVNVIPNIFQVSVGIVMSLIFYIPLKKPFDIFFNK